MVSLCIKTNNKSILNYLLDECSNFHLNDFYFSENKFKLYSNVILHYTGKEVYLFYNGVSDILTNCVINMYEDKIINRLINYNYFYFEEYEKNIIKSNAKHFFETSAFNERTHKFELIWVSFYNYILENKSLVLDGFINFRLPDYIKYLDDVIDFSVNKFIIDREYLEFINLLKLYINSRDSKVNILHLIYTNDNCIILDENLSLVPTTDKINATFLSDITFSSNDFALNTLLTLLPKKIHVHLISEQDEFIDTLQNIFDGRITICNDCNICKTYAVFDKIPKSD